MSSEPRTASTRHCAASGEISPPMPLDPASLAHVARRLRDRTPFMAWVFSRYAEIERLGLPQVARTLGASEEAFLRLHLCLRPRAEHFADDVKDLAAFAEIDAGKLAAVVRRVEVVDAMGASPAVDASRGALMAARARKRDGGKGKKP